LSSAAEAAGATPTSTITTAATTRTIQQTNLQNPSNQFVEKTENHIKQKEKETKLYQQLKTPLQMKKGFIETDINPNICKQK